MKLLLVDDELKLVNALAHLFKKNGYSVDVAHDGEIGLEMAFDTLPCQFGSNNVFAGHHSAHVVSPGPAIPATPVARHHPRLYSSLCRSM